MVQILLSISGKGTNQGNFHIRHPRSNRSGYRRDTVLARSEGPEVIALLGLYVVGVVAIGASLVRGNPVGFLFLLAGAIALTVPIYTLGVAYSIRKRTK